MSGLWSDYQAEERSTERFSRTTTTRQHSKPSLTSMMNPTEENTKPIFQKETPIFREKSSFQKLVTANNVLVIGLLSNQIKRYHVGLPELDDVLTIQRPVGDKIHEMFLDPTGKHLLISMESGEMFYGFTGKDSLVNVSKQIKCGVVDSVAWNTTGQNEIGTKEILLGNSVGSIFETKLNPSSDKQAVAYSKIVCSLERPESVTGLVFFHEHLEASKRTVVLVATPTQIYQYFGQLGKPTEGTKFRSIFVDNYPEIKFNIEATGLFHVSYSKYPQPAALVWMTGVGVQYYKISLSSRNFDDCDILKEPQLAQFSQYGGPVAIASTAFHLLLLYENGVEARSLINWKHVHYETLGRSSDAPYNTIAIDLMNPNKFYCFCKTGVLRFRISKEDRFAWRLYMEQRQFDQAELYAGGDPDKLSEITSEEADFYFEQGMFKEAAETYALSQRSFEEIALRFIATGDSEALIGFLDAKLESLRSGNSPTQVCMLVVWLVEIFLASISQLEKHEMELSESEEDTLNSRRAELRNFLSREQVVRGVKKHQPVVKMVQDMMSTYGNVRDLIFFAELMEDFETVICHHIHDQNYRAALNTLRKRRSKDLFYKYTPVLMQYIPRDTVDVLEQFGTGLEALKLLPSFIQCRGTDQRNQALRYLQFVVFKTKCKDQAIHNFLLSLFVQHSDETLLMDFLLKNDINIDTSYALRLCTEQGKWRACCYIYRRMGLFEEAVHLALTKLGDVKEAEQIAESAEGGSEEVVKKLWLLIARHVVDTKEDIKHVMEFVNRQDQVLKIEDILPFFKDFFYIDDFKEAICNSLELYNSDINRLSEDMRDATESAERIHNDIANLRRKTCMIESSKTCVLCDGSLLVRSFYVFPCTHMFHTKCLVREVIPHLSAHKAREVQRLENLMANLRDEDRVRTDQYKSAKCQLDEIVASECILCGEIIIKMIDKPFLTEDESEFERLKAEWL